MFIIVNSLVVFSLTLLFTKSKVFGGKREFVEQRYEAAKVGDQQPGWVHKIWHAWWTCPMCSGFWMALPVCFVYPVYGFFLDVFVVFGINWLLHCLENCLFFHGQTAELLDTQQIEDTLKKTQKTLDSLDRYLRE